MINRFGETWPANSRPGFKNTVEDNSIEKAEFEMILNSLNISDNFMWVSDNHDSSSEWLSCTPFGANGIRGDFIKRTRRNDRMNGTLSVNHDRNYGHPFYSIATASIFNRWESRFDSAEDILLGLYSSTNNLLNENNIEASDKKVSKMLSILVILYNGYATRLYSSSIPKKLIQLFKMELSSEVILMAIRAKLSLRDTAALKDVPLKYGAMILEDKLGGAFPYLSNGINGHISEVQDRFAFKKGGAQW